MSELTLDTLHRLCVATNRAAFGHWGIRNSCVGTSGALLDVLTAHGIEARPLRVEAAVRGFGPIGAVLGSFGDGSRRPAAAPGCWAGHLTVVAVERFLLDPTLDQVEGAEPWTSEVTDAFLKGDETLWFDKPFPHRPGVTLRYHAYPTKGGWKSAPAFRQGNRWPVVAAVLAQLVSE